MGTDAARQEVFRFGDTVCYAATRADFDRLNADMREEDRAECRVFGMDGDDGRNWDEAVAIEIAGELVGIVGFGKFADGNELSRERMMFFLTTNAVWRHRVAFVKSSRPVMRWAMNTLLPSWVNTVFSFPIATYRGSVEWQERVLGFAAYGIVAFNGIRHVGMIKRKGV